MANTPSTPPKIFLSEHRHRSTPQSHGTAAIAQENIDPRASSYQNIDNVKYDLKETATVSFHKMLEGIILRGILGPVDNDCQNLPVFANAKEEEVNKEFASRLKRAVDFCNMVETAPANLHATTKPDNKRLCEEIKYYLTQYCRTSEETLRYLPLVNLLNAILLWGNKNPDVIFLVNDPMIIESQRLGTVSGNTNPKRKPDIILIKMQTFKKWYPEYLHSDFNDCRGAIANQILPKMADNQKRSWSEIIQFWELKLNHCLTGLAIAEILKTYGDDGMAKCMTTPDQHSPSSTVLSESNSGTAGSSSTGITDQSCPTSPFPESSADAARRPSANIKKRKSQPLSLDASKKSRTHSGSKLLQPAINHIYGRPKVTPDVQCAYYAIEKFRSSWQVSHVSGIYLNDYSLEVLWYDAQGCIRSGGLDIVRQLPLLVFLITMQQDSSYLSGVLDETIPAGYIQVGEISRRFQLVGRMTYCGYLMETPTTSATRTRRGKDVQHIPDGKTTDDATHFFKVAWPEDSRQKEGEIIKHICFNIASLGEHRESVQDHIPEVVETRILRDTSTAIIRTLLGLPTKGSRSQYHMVSKKLSSLTVLLQDFQKFSDAYWEIVRCHRLLWVMGVAHGDISFNNLMYNKQTERGILNDFDLASVMNPGDQSPTQTGCRRTGTLAFMALKLLSPDGLRGDIPRLYRHEFESFVWVLLWASLHEEGDHAKHIRGWGSNDPSTMYSQKSSFLRNLEGNLQELKASPYHSSLYNCLAIVDSLDSSSRDLLWQQGTTTSDANLLENFVISFGKIKPSWVDFQIPPQSLTFA